MRRVLKKNERGCAYIYIYAQCQFFRVTSPLLLLQDSKFGIFDGYPLVNIQKAMERSTIFNGYIHYFYGHFLCRYVTN